MIKTNEELNARIKELKQLQAHIKDLEAQVGAIKEEIQNDMDERKEEKYNTSLYTIYWRPLERKDIDKKKLEEDGLLEKYQKTSVFLRLDIK